MMAGDGLDLKFESSANPNNLLGLFKNVCPVGCIQIYVGISVLDLDSISKIKIF